MGLLDEAIKEHLDLKRRRGADPAEVERAEREALGPVRRGPEAPEQVQAGADEALAYDQEDEEDRGEPFDDGRDELQARQVREPEPFDLEEQPRTEERSAGRESLGRGQQADPDDPFDSDELFADPRGEPTPPPDTAPESPPQQPSEHAGGETVEYEVEAALEQERGKQAEDDVLEETPEFLQDTPDHDRLWFEQRPPRDFNFDS